MKSWNMIVIACFLVLGGCGGAQFSTRVQESSMLLDNRQYEQARQKLMKLIRDYPDKPEPYYLLGLLYFETEQYGGCLINFDKAEYRGLPKTTDFPLKKGIALYRTGDYENAEKVLKDASSKSSTGTLQKYLGMARYRLRDYEGAVAAFRKASSMNEDSEAINAFGTALYQCGMNDESFDVFLMALNREPDNDKLIFMIGNISMLLGEYGEAIGYYSKIPAESGYHGISLYNTAEAYMKLGDYSNAVSVLETYIDEYHEDYAALYTYSCALIHEGDFSTAAGVCQALLDHEEWKVQALYNLGLVYYKSGNQNEAVRHFAEAVRLNPDNVKYRYAYGLALTELGAFGEAKAQMTEILALDPGNKDAQAWFKRYQTNLR